MLFFDRKQRCAEHLEVARLQIDHIALACCRIGFLSVHLHRRIDGRKLLALAHQRCNDLTRDLLVQKIAGRFPARDNFAFRIIGRGRTAERDIHNVSFVVTAHEGIQACSWTDCHAQHTRRKRIERSHMPNALLAEHAAHAIDHIVRGHSFWFIDREKKR